MAKYLVRCPACGWKTLEFTDPIEADHHMSKHVKREHPGWPPLAKFRRERVP